MILQVLGIVEPGRSLAISLGCPTANLNVQLDIKDGVYYGLASCEAIDIIQNDAVMFYRNCVLEVHFLGLDIDVYGYEIEVEVHKFVREVKKPKSENELIGWINEDKLNFCL